MFTTTPAFRVVTPKQASNVNLPLRLAWTVGGPAAGAKRFAVFLDQDAIRPGERLSSLLPEYCLHTTCPYAEFLGQQNVYVTSHPWLVLSTLPETTLGGHSSTKEFHSAIVVVVNGSGVRVGEEFAQTSFVYTREGL